MNNPLHFSCIVLNFLKKMHNVPTSSVKGIKLMKLLSNYTVRPFISDSGDAMPLLMTDFFFFFLKIITIFKLSA